MRVGEPRGRRPHVGERCRDPASARARSDRESLRPRPTSTPRPARMRASSSGTSRGAARSRAPAPRRARRAGRARRGRSAERSTPRKSAPGRACRCCEGDRHLASGRESLSKKLTILDEAGTLRQPVVERAGVRIGLLGEPVDAARARGPCLCPPPPRSARGRAQDCARLRRRTDPADSSSRRSSSTNGGRGSARCRSRLLVQHRRRAPPSAPPDRAAAPRSPPWSRSEITTL